MSKLGKLGSFFKRVGRVAPAMLALHPTLAPIAVPIAAAIQEAEAIKGSGPEKIAHVVGVATEAAKAVNAAARRKVLDPTEVKVATEAVVSAVISVVNVAKD